MATTSTIVYCDDNDLIEIYPGLSGFDLKKRIYNWQGTGTTSKYFAKNSGKVIQLYADGDDLGAAESEHGDVDANGKWFYDGTNDQVYYFNSAASPDNQIMESGRDWETVKSDTRKKASRMVESLLDSRMSREIMKDREGNYPEFIVRATGLKAITLLIKAHDPENPVVESFEEEFNEIIEGYRSGNITLPNSITQESSRGVIRTVLNDNATDLFPVELKGNYNGSGYELLKVKIESGDNGIIGTAKMTVYAKDSDQLKIDKVVDAETITGDFQSLGVSGLYIRWSGDDVASAVCTANDEYEIELHGSGMESTISQQGSIRMSRRYG